MTRLSWSGLSSGKGGEADLFVDFGGADERGHVGQTGILIPGQSGAVSEFRLQAAELGDGAIEGTSLAMRNLDRGSSVGRSIRADRSSLRKVYQAVHAIHSLPPSSTRSPH